MLMRVNRQTKAKTITFPSPMSGWNAKDSLAGMGVTEAVRLDNWFPGFNSVTTRGGFSSFATGMSTQVQTLAEFNMLGNRKLLAGANGKIYDITSGGAATNLTGVSAFASNAWQYAQFDDAGGGPRMMLVNGTSQPQLYNGTTCVDASTTAQAITGVTATTLIGIHVHKSRTYYWAANSNSFWYSAVNAIGGLLSEFKLGRLSGFGGNLVAMDTWSVDAGNGPADLAVFLMSSGVCVVYEGSDPSSGTDWALVGKYQIGEPLGYRSTTKIGGELYCITKSGYVSMTSAAKLGNAKTSPYTISDRIRKEAISAANIGGTLGGWQAILYPRGNYALFNVPVSTSCYQQHVVNTETGAWCRFTGQDAYCWCVYNNRLYFGGAGGVVYLADNGRSDAGMEIQCDAIMAWNFLQDPGYSKQVGMLRISGTTESGVIPYAVQVGRDYREISSTATGTATNNTGASWDTADWDTEDWPTEMIVFDRWNGIATVGDALSVRFRVASSSTGFEWFSNTMSYVKGGVF